MKFALAIHGSRGDVEPFAAVGLELQNRGHEVRLAVPPNMIGFVESAGLTTVAYGPSSEAVNDEDFIRNVWSISTPVKVLRASKYYLGEVWAEMGATLTSLADGTDLLMTGMIQQGLAINVAEYHRIPLAELHCFPVRVNGHILPALPSPLIRSGISAFWLAHWIMTKRAEDNQRRRLGLPHVIGPSTRRITERGSLEIQAYDELFFPGLAAEWTQWNGRRPFVGALTMKMPTDADDEISSWCAAGTPPIYFGFGSMPVRSFGATVEMISAACAELGERALIYLGANDIEATWESDRIKIAVSMSQATIFPA
jgi:UDP:flavonoid glycosyltransferase YjiC (YdhE family)